MSSLSARSVLPTLFYQTVVTLEPILAILGSLQTLNDPGSYVNSLSATTSYDPTTRFLFTQLVGGWLLFAFLGAVVLRRFDDVRLWKWILTGMAWSDALYLYSSVQAMGGWAMVVRVSDWRALDWVVIVSTLWTVGVRAAVLGGLFVRDGAVEKAVKDKKLR